ASSRLTVRCSDCWDSLIVIGLHGPKPCDRCYYDRKLHNPASSKIATCVMERLAHKQEVDLQLLAAARYLANATADEPIPGDVLQEYLHCDRRWLSLSMERLRNEWTLP